MGASTGALMGGFGLVGSFLLGLTGSDPFHPFHPFPIGVLPFPIRSRSVPGDC